MKYSNQWLKNQLDAKQSLKYIFFWGHQPAKDGAISKTCLSQWWASPFEVDGNSYATAEHWMMAQKALLFNDQGAFERTLRSTKPAEVKEIGRAVRNFDPVVWEANKFRIVVEGNYHKFRSNNLLAGFLVNTGERVLVEASPVDFVWGIGLAADDEKINDPYSWKGENLLGYALMEVRDQLSMEHL